AVGRNLRAAISRLPFWFSLRDSKEPLFLLRSQHPWRRPAFWGKRFVVFSDGIPKIGQGEHLRKRIQFMVDTGTADRRAAIANSAPPTLVFTNITFMECFQTFPRPEKSGQRPKVRFVILNAARLDM